MGTKPQSMWHEYRLGTDAAGRKYFAKVWLERDRVTDMVALYIEGTIVKRGGRLNKVVDRTLVDVVDCGSHVDFRDILVPHENWQIPELRKLAEISETYNSAVTGKATPELSPEVVMFLWEVLGMVAPD